MLWRKIQGIFCLKISKSKKYHNHAVRLLRYLAPEAFQGRFTKACDVFSLGINMLELACNLDLPRHGDL